MTETVATTPNSPSPGLAARFIGVIFSPRETYAAVAARPKWLGVMAITLIVGAGTQYAMLSSPELQDAIIDQQVTAMQERGGGSEAQVAQVEWFIGMMPAIYAGASFIIGPLFVALIAGVLVGIFSMMMGGTATFRQVYALVTHSGVISMLAGIFSAALVAAGVPPSGVQPPSANLAVFLPMLDEKSFAVLFLGAINLILVWWCISLAIGLGVLYRRRTGPIATALLGVYAVIALIIAAVQS
jgi:hypothetical protein